MSCLFVVLFFFVVIFLFVRVSDYLIIWLSGDVTAWDACRDHRLNDFQGYDHPAWDVKRSHEKQAREFVASAGAGGGMKMKVISLYTGLFLEDSFGVSVVLCMVSRDG